jgi:GTP-binding protein
MVERYLHGSKVLKQVFLLVDIRHAPGANDCQMYEWIEAQGFEPVIIATKLDKINRSQTQKQLKLLRTTLGCKDALMIPFSAKTKQGLEEIYALFESCD